MGLPPQRQFDKYAHQKGSSVKAYQGNALKLKRFADETFDLTLLFGPMYHLHSDADHIRALSEAKRLGNAPSVLQMTELQYEVANLSFQQEVVTNVAKKASSAIETLVKNG